MTERWKPRADSETFRRQRDEALEKCDDRIEDELRRLRTKIDALEVLVTLIDDANESCLELFRIHSARSSVENGGSATPLPDSFLR
jgi:hypothetical protein